MGFWHYTVFGGEKGKTTMSERVAVVAVHGVAYHPEAQTARDVAGLLERHRHGVDRNVTYKPFVEETIHIPVNPIDAALLKENPSDDKDVAFSRSLVSGYTPSGADAVYKTVRLKGGRVQDNKQVDVYEMYWNDLSRAGTGPFAAFSTLYLILFHLIDVGQLTLRKSELTGSEGALRWANGLLTVVVPLLNLMIFLFLLGMVPLAGNGELARGLLIVGPVVLLLGGAFVGVRKQSNRTLTAWMGGIAIVSAVVLGIFLSQRVPTAGTDPVCLIGGTVFGGGTVLGGLFYLCGVLDQQRPFPKWSQTTGIVGVVTFIVCVVLGVIQGTGEWSSRLATGFCTATSVLLLILAVVWVVFLCLGVWATLEAYAQVKGNEIHRRVADTVAITLWVPATLFLYLTLSIWVGFASITGSLFSRLNISTPPLLAQVATVFNLGKLTTVDHFVSTIILTLASHWYLVGLGILAVSLLPLLWAFGPSGVMEAKAPTDLDQSDEASKALGEWVSGGFKFLTLSVLLMLLAFVVFVGAASSMLVWNVVSHTKSLEGVFKPLEVSSFKPSGATLATSGAAGLAAVAALFSRLRTMFSKLGMVTGVILDVENHLREKPTGRTPRARMFTRYASLLRYLKREGYDKVIIVAHSQGTVLTADLLRLITSAEGKMTIVEPKIVSGEETMVVVEPALATVEPAMESVGTKIVTGEGAIATVKPAIKSVREAKEPSLHDLMNGEKLTLVSMGSPLRQLYALRFPDLYRWVEAKPGPVPAALHLKQWINFYRSGDYVGRGIWQANDHNGWQIGEHPTAVPAVTEICIGIGAHTHYWDETADSTVGTMLDSLISAPASSGEPQ